MKQFISICSIVAGLSAMFGPGPSARAQMSQCSHAAARTGVYVAPFDGDDELRQAVSATLNLQIWRLLEKENASAPGVEFGCGFIERGGPQAPLYAQLMLSGSVGRIGEDAVVVTSLKAVGKNDLRPRRPEIWTVAYGGASVSLSPVKDFYSFALFPMRRDVLARIPAIREVRLCPSPQLPPRGVCKGRLIGMSNLSHIDQSGDFAEVKLNDGTSGWIYLPTIGDGSEVVDFVSAVVRLQRGDYFGADALLDRVKGSIAGTGMRGESLFMQAVARELSGRSSSGALSAAAALNPSWRWVAQVQIMAALRDAAAAKDELERKSLAQKAKSLLDLNARMFAPNNSWFKNARAVSEAL